MAALGTIGVGTYPPEPDALVGVPISEYDINRGVYLGVLGVGVYEDVVEYVGLPVSDYVVRQIGTVFRPLWPTSGQRWPVGNSQFAPAGSV